MDPVLRAGGPAGLPGAEALRPLKVDELGRLGTDIGLRAPAGTEPGQSFEGVLGRLVEEVNQKQLAAGDAIHGLLSGENVPLHRVMIAAEEASISFQLMVEVRNKLLEAYQELMRMQV